MRPDTLKRGHQALEIGVHALACQHGEGGLRGQSQRPEVARVRARFNPQRINQLAPFEIAAGRRVQPNTFRQTRAGNRISHFPQAPDDAPEQIDLRTESHFGFGNFELLEVDPDRPRNPIEQSISEMMDRGLGISWRESNLVSRSAIDGQLSLQSESETGRQFLGQEVLAVIPFAGFGLADQLAGIDLVVRLFFELRFSGRVAIDRNELEAGRTPLQNYLIHAFFAVSDIALRIELLGERQLGVGIR